MEKEGQPGHCGCAMTALGEFVAYGAVHGAKRAHWLWQSLHTQVGE